jgi:hypothetical protein
MGTRLLAAGLVLGLAAAACTGDDDGLLPPRPDDGAATDTPSPTVAPDLDTPAAELRAAVGAALSSHVYLLGVVTDTVVREGSESPAVVHAQATLSDDTSAVTEIVAEAFGEEAGGRFADLWTAHVGFVVDYARASVEGDEALRVRMEQELLTFRDDLGAMLDELTGGVVPAETATAALEPAFDGELDVVDAQVGGGDVTAALRETSGRMPEVADLLAGAIVVHEPDRYRDSIEVPAAQLRSTFQAQLQEHVYLLWYAVDAGLRSGWTSTAAASTVATLDVNSRAIAETWGERFGADSERAFLRAWRGHVDAFLAWAQGAREAAEDDLEVFREGLGRIVREETRGVLDEERLAEELTVHTESVLEAIDARAADTRRATDLLRAAAGHMPVLADVIATAIVQRFPDVFAPDP